jgi:hypothetical protein
VICSSNVFFINNTDPNADPNPDPKLRLKPGSNPDPNPKIIISQHWKKRDKCEAKLREM